MSFKVHCNSSNPIAVGAHVYEHGSNIHPASGQSNHLEFQEPKQSDFIQT